MPLRVTAFCARRLGDPDGSGLTTSPLKGWLPGHHSMGREKRMTGPTLKCLEPEVKQVSCTRSSLAKISRTAPSKPQRKLGNAGVHKDKKSVSLREFMWFLSFRQRGSEAGALSC